MKGRVPDGQLPPAAVEYVHQRRAVIRVPQIAGVFQPAPHQPADPHAQSPVRILLRGRLRPVQSVQSLPGPAQPLAAHRQLVQLHDPWVLQGGKIAVGLLIPAALQLGGRPVIGHDPQIILPPQGPGHTLRRLIMRLHATQVQLVAAETPHEHPALQHQPHPTVPGRQVIALLQQGHGPHIVAALLIPGDTGHEIAIRLRQQPHRLHVPVLHHPQNGQLPPVQIRLQGRWDLRGVVPVHGIQHQAVRRQGTGQKPVQGVRECLPAVPEAFLIPVQQAFVPVLHQPLQLRQALPVPGQLQPPEQQLQQLRGRLHLSLFDLGQIRRRADIPAQALLAPAPLQPLLAQPQAHRRRTGGIGFLHMHPLPFLHPFCISVTQTRAFGNKQTPSAAGEGSLYAVVSRAWRRRGWRRPAAAGAASPRPFPCGRRRSAYRSWGCPSSSGGAGSEWPRQFCR